MEDQSVLNPLDIIIITVVFLGMYTGAKKGLFQITNNIASVVLSALAAARFWYIARNFFIDSLQLQMSPSNALLLSFIAVFIVAYIVFSRILDLMDEWGKKVKIDNALGAILGGAVATFVLSVAFVILGNVNFPSEANARGSRLYTPVRGFSRIVLGKGIQALQEVNRQVNKHGLNKPIPQNGGPQPAPQPGVNKPTPIR
ncbi:MAG: CvpA family protein [Bacteroidota bacterium]